MTENLLEAQRLKPKLGVVVVNGSSSGYVVPCIFYLKVWYLRKVPARILASR